jgi:LysM repeat protein
MRHPYFIFICFALLVAGCSTQNSVYPPAHVATSAETGAYRVYIVQPGDSAEKIAAQFHMTIGKLSVFNPGVALSPLVVGQKLFVSEYANK